MWIRTKDGKRAVNMATVESVSVEEITVTGRHPDDKYALMAHLPSGASFEIAAARDRRSVSDVLDDVAEEIRLDHPESAFGLSVS